MGSANKENLLYGLVNNRLSRGSFNGRPRQELDKDFLSRVFRGSANERGIAALRCLCYG